MVKSSFTDKAMEMLFEGYFADKKMTGRVGVELVHVKKNKSVVIRYYLENQGAKLWVSDYITLHEGSTFNLEPVTMDIDVEIQWK